MRWPDTGMSAWRPGWTTISPNRLSARSCLRCWRSIWRPIPDGFAKSPISVLRFRLSEFHVQLSTLHSSEFARLDLELFALPSLTLLFQPLIHRDYQSLKVPVRWLGLFEGF